MDLFTCDYTEGCHPRILEALGRTNLEQTSGYGTDPHCGQAADLIRRACDAPNSAVHFLVGGTQTNMTVIAALLRPYQGVLCADSGHINVHETGAVEASGHKVLPLPGRQGKITAGQIQAAAEAHRNDASAEHAIQPGMVYLSHPTEYGTLYTKSELEAISRVCEENNLLLFVDGARMGYGLAADGADVALPDLARLTDVFYIGGTKVGALFGEAVIFRDPNLCPCFRYMIKQRGGMLAKGRLLGIQFECLFEDDLYLQLGRHADELAYRVRDIFRAAGCPLLFDSPTNQQFPVLSKAAYEFLSREAQGEFWQDVDDTHSAYRFCTSWATSPAAVDRLEQAVKRIGTLY